MSGERAIVVLKRNGRYCDEGVSVLAVILGVPESVGWREIERAVEERFSDDAWPESSEGVFRFEGPKWEIENVHS